MKKLALFIALCAATLAHANPQSPFSGWSFIAGAGGVVMGNDASSSVVQELFQIEPFGDFALEGAEGRHDVFATNAAGMLGFGYSREFMSSFVLGVYVTANANYTSFEDHTSSTSTFESGSLLQSVSNELEMELQNDFAVLFKAGFVFDKRTLFYALAGPRWGNFETSLKTHSELGEIVMGEPIVFSLQGKDSQSGYELGYTVGAGIARAMTDKVIVGMEYVFSNYGDLDTLHVNASCLHTPNSTCTPLNIKHVITSEGELESSTNTIMATFAYMF